MNGPGQSGLFCLFLRWTGRRSLQRAFAGGDSTWSSVGLLIGHSLGGFLAFVKLMPLAKYRRKLPAGPYHVARIVAARHEDCGPCVQIEVDLARSA